MGTSRSDRRALRALGGLVLVSAATAAVGEEAGAVALHLQTNDGDKIAACTGLEQRKLRASLHRLAAGRAEDDAWRLVHALLCESGPGAHRVIAAHLPAPIAWRIDMTVPEEDRRVDGASRELRDGFARGFAWGVTAEPQGQVVHVAFYNAEFCWEGFDLRFAGKTWIVAGMNAGCD